MKTLRIMLGILMIIPLGLLVNNLIYAQVLYDPNSLSELAYLVFGIPILIFNLWVWIYPEIIEIYFLGKKDQDN